MIVSCKVCRGPASESHTDANKTSERSECQRECKEGSSSCESQETLLMSTIMTICTSRSITSHMLL